jgi:hypothetical protein
MAVAIYVTWISTPEVHPEFPPLLGTLVGDVMSSQALSSGRGLMEAGTGEQVAATIDHSRIRGSEPHITGSSEAASD